MFTLLEIAEEPSRLTSRLRLDDGSDAVFRPLTPADAGRLAALLEALSPESRHFSAFDGYDLATAGELCDAIARYDKLRLVLEEAQSGRIVGLVEFSLALTSGDIARFQDAGVRLVASRDCRFGLTLADDYQGRGVGTHVFPLVTEVARLLGKERIILWGGVRSDNHRAIRYYEKNGFRAVGSFAEADGSLSLDMILDLDLDLDPEPGPGGAGALPGGS
ncbi:GNAT family N-acetyltransferase [Streptomyces sp. NPDC059166]|uniref:GNAT family N-acetyltransferase n=1 Tax=Streptomyces sp. NPDC059166 TaxID=3346752 RepID=UPI0036A214F9